MEKLNMENNKTLNSNLDYIKKRFPNVIFTDNGRELIDFDKLKDEFTELLYDDKKEKYQLTWPGKREAIINANQKTSNTLLPNIEESVNFDETKNIYIEGDNLEALKILQESYLNKIDFIYIDPPYNTGNDFIYNDSFSKDSKSELIESGQEDEVGNRLISNNNSNGRFHSDWLSMLYPRIKLARNLLSLKGIIYISIDDSELFNLKKICDEIFGENNFIGNIVRVAKTTSFRGNYFAPSKDYILCYAKSISNVPQFNDEATNDKQFNKIEEDGPRKGEYYRDDIAFYLSTLETRPNQRYFIQCPDGELVVPPGKTMPKEKIDSSKAEPINGDGVWRWEQKQYLLKKDLLVFKETNRSPLLNQDGKQAHWNIYTKSYLNDKKEKGNIPRDLFEGFLNRNGSEELSKLEIPFSFPKPSKLIKYLMKISNVEKNAYVMDFFSGSATTADAVMQLNAEDNGKRKFIMVQLPEPIVNEDVTYKNLCKIGEERIRRAGSRIKNDTSSNIDYGFRIFKIDSSNMKDVYYKPSDIGQMDLMEYLSNIKEDRKPEDLLIQVMLDLGLTLDLKIEKKKVINNNIFYVNNNELIACFDDNIDINIIDEICKCNPIKAVFKDISFKYDKDKINLEEKIKKLSPETEVCIL